MAYAKNGSVWGVDAVAIGAILVVGMYLSMFGISRAIEPAFAVQMWTLFAALLAGLIGLVGVMGADKARAPSRYENGVIKAGVIASMFWGVAGFLVGLIIALQLAFPDLFYFSEWGFTNFGRLRPLHTSAVIFAFGGNVLIATSFWSCSARAARAGWGLVALVCVLGLPAFIVLAGTGYLEGVTEGREYAEPPWYTDIWLTIVWVAYLLVFLGTLWKRQEKHIYVANWFYLAFIVTIALLHLVNNLAVPVSAGSWQSYSLFSGVQDALTQWWYGHNAVGFFLTAGFLGIMYYFIPKQANRPVYSYRLSIIHFWALIFLYIWAGPHHLHYTALPQWAQTLGMTFSIMLWMPSWGGMINGLMTLSGAWDKLRTDPVLRMLVVSVAFYGMSTFEGPVMSIRAVNSLSHYTDWTIGHVHSGALGWVGFVSFGALYCLTPWLWKKKQLHSLALVDWHFWLATIGIVLYITSMWVAGVMQGLMWRAYNEFGFLEYSFVETVEAMHPYYAIRALGGGLFLVGALLMAYNLWRTATGKEPAHERASDVPVLAAPVAAE
ncbi:MAG: cytochrome-c oxidase, cbb3-type subunit I [Caulobacteraceae bacterium]|nr:cytochrome-c oxidase, cbb3-type subunit I [Caulobacteraceae bacterium]